MSITDIFTLQTAINIMDFLMENPIIGIVTAITIVFLLMFYNEIISLITTGKMPTYDWRKNEQNRR